MHALQTVLAWRLVEKTGDGHLLYFDCSLFLLYSLCIMLMVLQRSTQRKVPYYWLKWYCSPSSSVLSAEGETPAADQPRAFAFHAVYDARLACGHCSLFEMHSPLIRWAIWRDGGLRHSSHGSSWPSKAEQQRPYVDGGVFWGMGIKIVSPCSSWVCVFCPRCVG